MLYVLPYGSWHSVPLEAAETVEVSLPAPHVGIGLASSELKVLTLTKVGCSTVVMGPPLVETGGLLVEELETPAEETTMDVETPPLVPNGGCSVVGRMEDGAGGCEVELLVELPIDVSPVVKALVLDGGLGIELLGELVITTGDVLLKDDAELEDVATRDVLEAVGAPLDELEEVVVPGGDMVCVVLDCMLEDGAGGLLGGLLVLAPDELDDVVEEDIVVLPLVLEMTLVALDCDGVDDGVVLVVEVLVVLEVVITLPA